MADILSFEKNTRKVVQQNLDLRIPVHSNSSQHEPNKSSFPCFTLLQLESPKTFKHNGFLKNFTSLLCMNSKLWKFDRVDDLFSDLFHICL